MKSKPVKQQAPELEEDDDEVEVGAGGPAIAAAKKSKMAIIAASTILTVVVFYFFFFKGENKSHEKLEAIEPPKPASVASSEFGRSPFEIEKPKEKSDDYIDLLAKPSAPDLPTLPELPEDAAPPEQIKLSPEAQKQETPPLQQLLPTQLIPGQQPAGQQVQQALEQKKSEAAIQDKLPEQPRSDPRYAPIIVFSGQLEGGAPARSVGYDENIVQLKKDPLQELQQTEPTVVATYISDLAHTIAQGKLLTAVLETAINTEIPGSVRAVISRDVYGESGNDVLIPKGSRLFVSYSSEVKRGQGRVQIGWTRLIRPDGVDLAITFNASDQFGRAGIPGDVDNKYASVIANSLLTSILAVGGVAAAQELLSDQTATTTTTNPTQGTTTTTGSATNQALYDVTKTIIDTVGQIISSTIDLSPIIRVPQGTRITVIVNADIKVPSVSKR